MSSSPKTPGYTLLGGLFGPSVDVWKWKGSCCHFQEPVFDQGVAKDIFRTVHGHQESSAAASDMEAPALARAWCPQ